MISIDAQMNEASAFYRRHGSLTAWPDRVGCGFAYLASAPRHLRAEPIPLDRVSLAMRPIPTTVGRKHCSATQVFGTIGRSPTSPRLLCIRLEQFDPAVEELLNCRDVVMLGRLTCHGGSPASFETVGLRHQETMLLLG